MAGTIFAPLDPPTRAFALQRLATIVPNAGRAYAATRNFDNGPAVRGNVSMLSPFIRHRLITEDEVARAVLATHSLSAASKFIQEVCWRTYWKGWLEQHPSAWTGYLESVHHERAALREDDARAAEVAAAERGDTGIACFDAWARELAETGYLHNHARMWFASIWIFTLRLPWVLGADFFMRHLCDGDPASNTLSWRWVAGLHTRGKTYLARASNIATYTGGRFTPQDHDLAAFAPPLTEATVYTRAALPAPAQIPKAARLIVLMTEEDMSPETWPIADATICGIATAELADLGVTFSAPVAAFKRRAADDARARAASHWDQPAITVTEADGLVDFARARAATHIVTSHVPVGYVQPIIADWSRSCASAGVPLLQIARAWDQQFWPHAKAGFFQLKDHIPAVFAALGIVAADASGGDRTAATGAR